jgi:hypothetical protein
LRLARDDSARSGSVQNGGAILAGMRPHCCGFPENPTMPALLKTAVLSAALAATTLAAMPHANAGERWQHRHHRNHDAGALVAAGVLGLAVGAIVAGANRGPHYYDEPVYGGGYQPYPRPYRQHYRVVPRPVYDDGYGAGYASFEPWSAAWYDYCERRYRTFDPQSGTFIGNDGRQHFCVAY